MSTERINESYYQYRASCYIRRVDGTEKIKRYQLDTDICYGDLYFWNRYYFLKKSQNLLYNLAAQDTRNVKCKILQENLVLIPRFTYNSNQKKNKSGNLIKRFLLNIEMLLLLLLNTFKSSVATEKNGIFSKGVELEIFPEARIETEKQVLVKEEL
ncbi:hypothetical protein [Lacrimispora algidixylanolytica]|uniref:Uncharacterized protein n=1 Tax=Lacrimispora algidixylanolytica TaxID=94868 RepID=A0A419SSI0_9FIRM|nr:hypothetical protein [Lacrimispora algidixylanolytica]RKD28112.1 hypothetical protein BET01_11235 [Lacrimispora algidixylanolytica]